MKNKIILCIIFFRCSEICSAQTYIYDNNHQITQIKYDNGAIIAIQYDANGNRISYLVSAGGALPLQLLDFNAQKSATEVLLSWSTSAEINTDKFLVEYSKDGNAFSSFAAVPAHGNSPGRSDYSTIHCCPVEGVNYYRLKMMDKDGNFKYSEVRKIIFEFVNTMTLYPNPAPDKSILNISFAKPFTKDGTITIYNMGGSQIYNYRLLKGEIVAKINTATLSAGSYYVVASVDGNQYKEKFVKQ